MPLPAGTATRVIRASHAGTLALEERGQDVRLSRADALEIAIPPRFGRFSVTLQSGETVEVARVTPGSARGDVLVSLDCAAPDAVSMDWPRKVQELTRQTSQPLNATQYDTLKPALDDVRETAQPGYQRALAQHLQAQALLYAGRSGDAAAAFAAARSAWDGLGDRHRALAALVGQVEELQRRGAYADVLAATRAVPSAPDGDSYFGVRLEASRCLALQNLSRPDESADCYRWVLSGLERLGETLERISTLQDLALLELDRGELKHAATLAQNASRDISESRWDQLPGMDVTIVRGRVERLLADVAVRQGDIGGGLRHSRRAFAFFVHAKHERWQANTLLRIAAIYNQIGAYSDALESVDLALDKFSTTDARPRIAVAKLTKAEIELAQEHAAEATRLANEAAHEFDDLHMGVAGTSARLTLVEADLAAGKNADAAETLRRIDNVPASLRYRARLLGAELDAGVALPSVAPAREAHPLSEWLRAQRLDAARRAAEGKPMLASQELEAAAQDLTGLAARAGNPVLQTAIERRKLQLVPAAVALMTAPGAHEKAAAAWRWVQLIGDVPARSRNAGSRSSSAHAFDVALSQSLLQPDVSRDERRRALDEQLQAPLLDVVAEAVDTSATSAPAVPLQALADFRRSLPRDTLFVAILPSADGYVELVVGSDRADLLAAKGKRQGLDERAGALIEHIRRFDADSDVDDAARELSAALLDPIAGTPPRRLLLFVPGPLSGLPWALLRWPGSAAPLLETTGVSLVLPALGATPAPATLRLHVLGAKDADRRTSADLPLVDSELAAVASARRALGWQIVAPPDANARDALMRALADPGAWLHFSGHGASSTEHLGRSGLWLDAAGTDGATVVSWVDVMQNGVAADTVVLNACALGSSPRFASAASTAFSEAVLQAGAHEVVAALWPISDAAAAYWAQGFYAALPERPRSYDIAEALRQSMLRVRANHAFRNPSYWAFPIHLSRLRIAAPSTAPTDR